MPVLNKVYFFDENLPVTPKSLPKPRSIVWFPAVAALFLIISISFLLVIYLMLDAKIVSTQYKNFQLETSKTKYIERNAVLAMEMQKLSALSRIDNIARKKLGMDMPKERILIEPENLAKTNIPGISALPGSATLSALPQEPSDHTVSSAYRVPQGSSRSATLPGSSAYHQGVLVGIP